LPRGTVSPLNRAALSASHYLARYELGREALGWVAVAARRHAARNPDALYRTALSIDEYLAAEAVSTPLSLYDCDRPCDGAVAVVVSASTLAADLAQPAVWLDAVASPRVAPAQSHGANPMGAGLSGQSPATQLWSRASRTQEDVDFFSVDDGFTLTTLNWLEALDFCEPGDAAEFVAGGIRIGPDGVLPINPDGGRLAAGHPGGYGSLREAVLQLRGRAETRQIPSVRVAAVASGTPGWGNALLLTTES
jgi:acetyl-CoA acetyltransferase